MATTKTRRFDRTVVRVLAIVTQPLTMYGLHALVDRTRGLTWCGATPNMETALSALSDHLPHVVLVDSRLDRDAGGIRALRDARPDVRVIGLVRGDYAPGYIRAIRAGEVNGLVSQSASTDIMVSAIRASLGEQPFVDPQLALWLPAAPDAVPTQRNRLTHRQLEVLTRLAAGRRNAEIADELGVTTETIRKHVKRIMNRLETQDRAHAVARGYQLGLVGFPGAEIPPTT
ncbi:response regulator transcription factor [Amycolatopsis sp. SID8362]|uniref:response regulator transcription factor n=1 Tax=Amycolatopsis sp. SID8362 TaxID=2690346 RepID=UPI00136F5475|nr:response regulator transcription factor [Amycolatopsis sp. SID8362]NBH10365.1 hypothetical protein [Amycolatopsis sp. SID8362]NED47060.1 response regulator transcription factor [Amycolatopsis sp. SID8362]